MHCVVRTAQDLHDLESFSMNLSIVVQFEHIMDCS